MTARDALDVPCRSARGPCSGRSCFDLDAVHGSRRSRGEECDDKTYRARLDTDGHGDCVGYQGVDCFAASQRFGSSVSAPDSGSADLIVQFKPEGMICEVYGPAGRVAAGALRCWSQPARDAGNRRVTERKVFR